MPSASDILKRFKHLKTLPHVGIQLSKLLSDEMTTTKQLEEVIRLDPTLVLRLLKLVNSPYYGLREKVKTISQAVVYIGLKNLRNLVVVEALKSIFKSDQDTQLFSRRQLWLHSAVVSICCQMISERVFRQKGEDAFLCGILHDIGLIVEDQVENKLFLEVCQACSSQLKPLAETEKMILGTDHCSVGALLAKDWKFPQVVHEGIKYHHSQLEKITPNSITGILQISEYFSEKLGYSAMSKATNKLPPQLIKHIGDNLSEYKALMRDMPEEITFALEIYQLEN